MDESFKLDEITRSRVAPHYDVDALEGLLQAVEPEARRMILEAFLRPEFQTRVQGNQWYTLIGSTNPRFNELLAEVWQPFWDDQPEEVWADPNCRIPGRELARRRRGATKRS